MGKTALKQGSQPRRDRGRPPHQPVAKSRRAVEALAGHGIPVGRIAEGLNIGVGTLYRHYRVELERGSAAVEAALIANLTRMARGSDGIAAKATIFALSCRFGWSKYAPPTIAEEMPDLEGWADV